MGVLSDKYDAGDTRASTACEQWGRVALLNLNNSVNGRPRGCCLSAPAHVRCNTVFPEPCGEATLG